MSKNHLKSQALLERRKNIVANGVGVFNTATVSEANGATIIDADGNELIDFAGGIGVVLNDAQNLFQWQKVAMVLVSIFAVVIVAEIVAIQIRKRLI